MSKEKIIQKHVYLNRQACCACSELIAGTGFREKYIIGYTPEGYIYAYHDYCKQCGEAKIQELKAENKLYHLSFIDE